MWRSRVGMEHFSMTCESTRYATNLPYLLGCQQSFSVFSKILVLLFHFKDTTSFQIYMHHYYLPLVANVLAETRSHARRSPGIFAQRS